MRKLFLYLIVFFFLSWGTLAYTAEDHASHEHSEKVESHNGHEEGKAQGESEKHAEGDNHGEHAHSDEGHEEHEEERGSAVGPDKGITEKAEAGFKLAPEAFKTMGIQSKAYSGSTIQIPLKAVVSIKNEKTVFRIRNGWIKRVKAEILKKNSDTVTVSSQNFREGDQIVTGGSGFLRIAEIYAEEGASHSHAH